MKALEKSGALAASSFEHSYCTALLAHLQSPSEATLGKAYELGRAAVHEGKTLLDTVAAHHLACRELLDTSGHLLAERLSAAADFLSETLSTFEMTHRGFQEAVHALRHMNETLEERIKRLAYSIHDEASQLLVVAHLELSEIGKEMPGPYQEKMAHVNRILRQIEEQLRRFSHELRPTILDDLGWLPAIEELAGHVSKRSNLSIKVDTNTRKRLPTPQETILYRIVQESLANAVKHAQASRIRIDIRRRRTVMQCSVQDDGVGFDLQAVRSDGKPVGLGLTAMRERLHGIGGTLQIDTSPGGGTKILAEFPLEVANECPGRSCG